MDECFPASDASAIEHTRPKILRILRGLFPRQDAFVADKTDGIFALLAFILGFIFARWVLFSWQGWGVTAFALAYCSVVTLYLWKKGITLNSNGWFWLAAVVLTAVSYSLWTNNGLEPWRSLFLFFGGVYWVICITGLTILGKTSNWLGVDALNGLFFIPFRNYGCQYQSLIFLNSKKSSKGKRVYSIALGLVLAFLVGSVVLPQLMEADSGGFAYLADRFFSGFSGLREKLAELCIYGVLAVPIAAYLFGLVAGSAHKRGCMVINKDALDKVFSSLRRLPAATIYTMLGLLCCLYGVFIASQLPYFFSAFIGERPEGWLVYSEYARSGFFELCRITAINLTVLAAVNLFGEKGCKDGLVLKVLNSLLALLTLLLITTAFSKMVMYIEVYGLSMRRLLPCFFMFLLAIICCGVIVLQKWRFSMVRLTVGVGAVMLCMLCLSDLDSLVVRYNADRYLAGTLSHFDVEILYRAGPAGVDAAIEVYDLSDDAALQAEIKTYLFEQRQLAVSYSGHPWDNYQMAKARQKMAEWYVREKT